MAFIKTDHSTSTELAFTKILVGPPLLLTMYLINFIRSFNIIVTVTIVTLIIKALLAFVSTMDQPLLNSTVSNFLDLANHLIVDIGLSASAN